jgi:hypothetical protein
MAVPRPEIGLVIRHAYLWWNEARTGREEGRKDRPCVIVHLRPSEHQELETYICPVTHTGMLNKNGSFCLRDAGPAGHCSVREVITGMSCASD